MIMRHRAVLLLGTIGLGFAALIQPRASQSVSAAKTSTATIKISHAWSRATPGGAPIGVGYATITNNGKLPDRLLGGSVGFAKRIEVHTMTMTKGVMRMRKLKGGLVIAPEQTVTLKPGGQHLMLIGLQKAIQKGKPFTAKLRFEKAGDVAVTFTVEAIGSMQHMDGTMHETASSDAMAKMPMKKSP